MQATVNTKGTLKELTLNNTTINAITTAPKEADSISIYLPTHADTRSETLNEDEIRFKNILQELEGSRFVNDDSRRANLQSLYSLIDNIDFWTHQKLGLALFVRNGNITYVRLPYEVNSFFHTGEAFIGSPLQLINTMRTKAFVLNINLDSPELHVFEADSLQVIENANMPQEMEKALNIDEHQHSQQFHTGTAGNGAMYHGHGGSTDYRKVNIENYLRLIAKQVDTHLQNESAPLILAGVKERISSIRKLLSYPYVTDDCINGNYEDARTHDALSLAAHNIVEDINEKKRQNYIEQYQEAHGNWRTVEGASEVIEASMFGNVNTLFIKALRTTTDTIRSGVAKATRLELPKDINELEKIISYVKEQGGEIVAVEKDSEQPKELFSALLRRPY